MQNNAPMSQILESIDHTGRLSERRRRLLLQAIERLIERIREISCQQEFDGHTQIAFSLVYEGKQGGVLSTHSELQGSEELVPAGNGGPITTVELNVKVAVEG